MKRITLFVLLSLLGMPSLLRGQSRMLTIQECRQLAIEHNKEMAAARQQTLYADYLSRSYRANYFPNLSATGLGLYSNLSLSMATSAFALPVGTLDPTAGFQPNGSVAAVPEMNVNLKTHLIYGGAVTLEQPLFMGGKITAAYRMARSGLDMARSNELLTESQVIVETEKAYALLVKAQEMEKVANSYHSLLSQLYSTVESAVRHGMKQRNDLLKVEVFLGNSELGQLKARNAVLLAKMNLCHMIGWNLGEDILTTGEYPGVEQTALNRSDITQRPEYAILESQVNMAREQVRLEQAEMLPSLGLAGAFGYANGMKGYLNGTQIGNKSLIDNATYAVLLKLSIPIYHFGARTNKVKAAKAQLRQKELEQETSGEKMLLELTKEANNLDESFKEVEIASKALESATLNKDVSKNQYDQGMETLTNLLEAQAMWQEAYEKSVEAHFQLYNQYVAYLKASGQLVGKD